MTLRRDVISDVIGVNTTFSKINWDGLSIYAVRFKLCEIVSNFQNVHHFGFKINAKPEVAPEVETLKTFSIHFPTF